MKQLLSASAIAVIVLAALTATSVSASVGWSACTSSFVDNTPGVAPSGFVSICRDSTLAIAYDPTMINPAFDAYFLDHTRERILIPGRDEFYEDPDLQSLDVTQAPTHSHAMNETWNKGHLAPSHALSWSKDTKHATYTMANVAPQAAYFNQHPWARLEGSVIDWTTANNKSLHVITGVGYKDRSSARRTYDGISVPDYYWKILCDVVSKKSVGFYGDNEPGKNAVHDAMTVKTIQDTYYNSGETGDLFPDSSCKISELDSSHWSGIAGPVEDTPSVFSTTFRHLQRMEKMQAQKERHH